MADLTLPGDIPGLLRRGSPVIIARGSAWRGWSGTVVAVRDASVDVSGIGLSGEVWTYAHDGLHLLLTDATGRAHAAWWLGNVPFDDVLAACDALGVSTATRKNAMESCMSPVEGWSHDADADVIRRVVLHVARRTDND